MDDVIGKLLEENNVPDTPTARAVYRKMLEPKEWVGLTDDDIDQGLLRSNHALQTAGAWRDGVEWAAKQLKEKNT